MDGRLLGSNVIRWEQLLFVDVSGGGQRKATREFLLGFVVERRLNSYRRNRDGY